MILNLLIIITILAIISMIIFKRDFLAPSVLITLSFFVATLCAFFNSENWNFSNPLLILIIISGLISFIFCSYMIFIFDSKIKRKTKIRIKPIMINEIEIPNYKLYIYLIFQIVLYMIALFYIIKSTGSGLSLHFLSQIIGSYYEAKRNGMTIYSSQLVNIGQILNMSGIYLLIFIAVNNLLIKKKNSNLLYINIIIGIIGSTLDGTRTAAFMYIIATIIIYIALINKKNGWKRNIKLSFIIKMLIISIFLVYFFLLLASLQGRELSDVPVIDVISSYLGAPLKNLELFLNEGRISTGVFGGETFMSTYSWLYSKTGNILYDVPSLYKYRWIAGKGIGNVYTIFMPIYNDFGFYGVIIILGSMGLISQKVYNIIKFKRKNIMVDYTIIIYSYIAFSVIFSFFSNKFFESVISRAGIYFIIGLLFFDFCFFKVRIKNYNIYIRKYSMIRRK